MSGQPMYILGVNAFHGDASACLLKDGELVAAVEEERIRRIKHCAGFPQEAIRHCLAQAGIGIGQVGHLAVNQDAKANLWRKIGFSLTGHPDLRLVADRIRNRRERANLRSELEGDALPGRFAGEIHQVEHHVAHLSSAFHVSPFMQAVVASVDGFGDFASAAWGVGRGADIAVEEKIYFPHSLGIFYEALTQWLGFPNYGDEYKVMGLAPYGRPAYLEKMRQVVKLKEGGRYELALEFFRHHREKVEYEWGSGAPRVGALFSDALTDLLGPERRPDQPLTQVHMDVAHSVQSMYEEALFHLLNALHARYRIDELALAGGCALNSVANGKIYCRTPFKRLYLPAAAGDAGGAIGAAFAVWHRLGGGRRFMMEHAYWGPQFDTPELGALLEARRAELASQGCAVQRIADEAALCGRTARAIAAGKVAGWFQGRMEWGPRALGNRSILGDPRRADMKDILNLKIKRRESFRPFAPSILREAVGDWFEAADDVPFMMQVYPVRPEQRQRIPAVTHVDGSGRLQTVHRATNPRYHALIDAFARLTGVPLVLNTSFNENEPVVCRPEEALDCFLRTRMDVLVLGDWFIERGESCAE